PTAGVAVAPGTDTRESLIAPTPDPNKPATDKAAAKDEDADPDNYLLRFFDFDVKPNKQYLYRVFLVLKNPNFNLNPNVLADPELASQPYLGVLGAQIKDASGKIVDWKNNPKYWSPPCLSDRLPGDMRLLGGKVAAARGPQEINAEVRILRWMEQSGLNGSYSKDGVIRGTLLNFPQAPVKTPGVSRTTPFDLLTNCILLD